jgi:hypothetical protein
MTHDIRTIAYWQGVARRTGSRISGWCDLAEAARFTRWQHTVGKNCVRLDFYPDGKIFARETAWQ